MSKTINDLNDEIKELRRSYLKLSDELNDLKERFEELQPTKAKKESNEAKIIPLKAVR